MTDQNFKGRGEVKERTALLLRKKRDPDPEAGPGVQKPTRRQSAEISNLMSQLTMKKQKFTTEVHLSKDDPNYGKPLEGTQTAARGRKAHQHISREIVELCEIIWTHGQMHGNYDEDDETTVMAFGELFQMYTRISSKVVGLLLRARKYELVYFEGETLFQGQNDLTPIFLIRSLPKIREMFKSGSDPKSFEWGKLTTSETKTGKNEKEISRENQKPGKNESKSANKPKLLTEENVEEINISVLNISEEKNTKKENLQDLNEEKGCTTKEKEETSPFKCTADEQPEDLVDQLVGKKDLQEE